MIDCICCNPSALTLSYDSYILPHVFSLPPQLIFSLSTAREWKCEHNGFHYPSFYDFVVNYFEDVEDDTALENANELLDWWTWCVF